MKHCVFCGAKDYSRNYPYICAAHKTADILETMFTLENDAVLCGYHAKIIVKDDPKDANLEIYFENSDSYQLIEDCMRWAVEYHTQVELQKSLHKKGRKSTKQS